MCFNNLLFTVDVGAKNYVSFFLILRRENAPRRRSRRRHLTTQAPIHRVQSNHVPVPNPVSKKRTASFGRRLTARAGYLPPALLRGGVLGLLPIMLPKPPMSFLSAGFKIWKEHMRFSSTVIIAPALSNSPQ